MGQETSTPRSNSQQQHPDKNNNSQFTSPPYNRSSFYSEQSSSSTNDSSPNNGPFATSHSETGPRPPFSSANTQTGDKTPKSTDKSAKDTNQNAEKTNHERHASSSKNKNKQKTRRESLENTKKNRKSALAHTKETDQKTRTRATTRLSPKVAEADEENQQGNFFFNRDMFEEAEKSYTRAIACLHENHSDRILLFKNRAKALIKQSKYEESLKDCEKAIKLANISIMRSYNITPLLKQERSNYEMQYVKVLSLKSESLVLLERYSEAISVYKKIISADESLTTKTTKDIFHCKKALKEQGNKLFKQKKFKEAEDKYHELIYTIMLLGDGNSEDGDLILLFSNLAASHFMRCKYIDCLSNCNKSIKLSRKHIHEKKPLSPLLRNSGNTVEAILVKVLFRKARVLEELKRNDDAIQAYKDALSLDKLHEEAIDNLTTLCNDQGNSYYKNKLFSKAIVCYTIVIDCLPESHGDSILFFTNRAAAFDEQGDLTACLCDCQTAVERATSKIESNEPITHLLAKENTTYRDQLIKSLRLQAHSFEMTGNYQESIASHKRLLLYIPNDKQAMKGCKRCETPLKEQGDYYYRNKKFSEAEICYTSVITALSSEHSDLVILYNNRAATFIEQHKYGHCLEDCKIALELVNKKMKENAPVSPLFKKAETTYKAQLIKLLRRQAQAFEALNGYFASISTYEHIMIYIPEDKQANKGLRRCKLSLYQQQGDTFRLNDDFAKAEVFYTNAIHLLPAEHNGLINLLINRAYVLMRQDKYTESLKDCNIAIQLSYSHIHHLKRLKKTIEEKLIKALTYKAWVLEASKKYEKAITAYEEIMDITQNTTLMSRIKQCMIMEKKRKEEEVEANLSEAVKELREKEKRRMAEEAERFVRKAQVNAKVNRWKEGKEGDFKALVGSLNMILWPEAQITVAEMNDLKDAKKCKEIYYRVILKVHPDKLPKSSTVEHRMLANLIFVELNYSWTKFKRNNAV